MSDDKCPGIPFELMTYAERMVMGQSDFIATVNGQSVKGSTLHRGYDHEGCRERLRKSHSVIASGDILSEVGYGIFLAIATLMIAALVVLMVLQL